MKNMTHISRQRRNVRAAVTVAIIGGAIVMVGCDRETEEQKQAARERSEDDRRRAAAWQEAREKTQQQDREEQARKEQEAKEMERLKVGEQAYLTSAQPCITQYKALRMRLDTGITRAEYEKRLSDLTTVVAGLRAIPTRGGPYGESDYCKGADVQLHRALDRYNEALNKWDAVGRFEAFIRDDRKHALMTLDDAYKVQANYEQVVKERAQLWDAANDAAEGAASTLEDLQKSWK